MNEMTMKGEALPNGAGFRCAGCGITVFANPTTAIIRRCRCACARASSGCQADHRAVRALVVRDGL